MFDGFVLDRIDRQEQTLDRSEAVATRDQATIEREAASSVRRDSAEDGGA